MIRMPQWSTDWELWVVRGRQWWGASVRESAGACVSEWGGASVRACESASVSA